MNTARDLRTFTKRYFPIAYSLVRSILFPIHSKIKSSKRASFRGKTIVHISHAGAEFDIVLNPDNGFVDTEIYTNGIYEPDILNIIKKYLPVDGTYVDIGANIGQHSLFAAAITNKHGKVISFEPIPKLVSQINESTSMNNFQQKFIIHQLACSNKEEILNIKIKPGNIGGSSIHHHDESFDRVQINTATADSLLKNESRVDLIKIDTEGHEVEALIGLENTLRIHKPVLIIEFSPSLWNNDQRKSEEFFKIISPLYKIMDIENGHKEITEWRRWLDSFSKLQTNLLCVRK